METGNGGPITRRDFLKKVGAIAFLTGMVPLMFKNKNAG